MVPSARELGIPWEKLNVHGGAIALGHPFGMTGARIMTTLLNGLDDAGARYGMESMCVGGGQGMAMIVERLSLAPPKPRKGGDLFRRVKRVATFCRRSRRQSARTCAPDRASIVAVTRKTVQPSATRSF